MDLTDLNKVVKTTKREEIDVFFHPNPKWLNKNHAPGKQHACNDADPEGGDGPCLSHSLSVVNTYTKVTTGSKQVAVIVKNLTAILITIVKGAKVTQVVAANAVTQMEVAPGTLEKLDGMQGIQQTRILIEWRREVLFQQLDLSGLEGWSNEDEVATHALLAEYHDIFSLEPGELGCMDLAILEIRVVDDEPLKREVPKNSPTHGG